jgi:pilus assembly protein CpaE
VNDKLLSDLLKKARSEFKRGNRKRAAALVNKILRRDFNFQDVWELLHEEYGEGLSFSDFQRKFIHKYYPKKVHLLERDASKRKEPSAQKSVRIVKRQGFLRGLFARLFGFRSQSRGRESVSLRGDQVNTTKDVSSFDQVEKSVAQVADVPIPSPQKDRELSADEEVQKVGTEPLLSERSVPPAHRDGTALPVALDSLELSHPDDLFPQIDLSEGETIKVLVVDDITETRETVTKLLQFDERIELVGKARSGFEAIKVASERKPDVILMDINMPDMDGLEATRHIRESLPYVEIVILTVQEDIGYMREAIVSGARNYLVKPPTVEDLFSSIFQAYEIVRHSKKRFPPVDQTPIVQITKDAEQEKIISIYSPKGGVGRTTLAANLAVVLQQDDSQVALVDGSLQFGSIAISFNELGKNSILDLAPRVAELDHDIVEEVMLTHASSGVKLLVAPPKPEYADQVVAEDFRSLLKFLRKMYAYIIVDTAPELSGHTLSVLEASDLILLVTTQDIPTLDKVRRFLDLAPSIGLNAEKILLVMNLYDDRINISPEIVSRNLKKKFTAVVPYDHQAVLQAINRGSPFILNKNLHSRPVAQGLWDLASSIRRRQAELSQGLER